MNTSDVLNKAADLIEERGWVTGSGWSEVDNGLCLEGALLAASGLCRSNLADFTRFYTDCSAYEAVAAYLGRTPLPKLGPIVDALWQWNDYRERTAAEVIEVLRACAVIEAAKENAETRQVVSA